MSAIWKDTVYLDTEKTGSTFVITVMKSLLGSPQVFDMHQGVAERDPEKFYFISVRNPFDQYLSLFTYGQSGQGAVRRSLVNKGREDLYEDFNAWLDFVLAPDHAGIVSKQWKGSKSHEIMGVMSFRFLRLSIHNATKILLPLKRREGYERVYHRHLLWETVLRTETLTSDLEALLIRERERMGITQSEEEIKALPEFSRQVNKSPKGPNKELHDILTARSSEIAEREWLVCEQFGYTGPSPLPALP